uniref:Uncharacterized protein n=1 Tax=Bubo bubo TaxID=30461 RepID=A0A8C0EZ11_BUBBB
SSMGGKGSSKFQENLRFVEVRGLPPLSTLQVIGGDGIGQGGGIERPFQPQLLGCQQAGLSIKVLNFLLELGLPEVYILQALGNAGCPPPASKPLVAMATGTPDWAGARGLWRCHGGAGRPQGGNRCRPQGLGRGGFPDTGLGARCSVCNSRVVENKDTLKSLHCILFVLRNFSLPTATWAQ